jgi:hypothetical protein
VSASSSGVEWAKFLLGHLDWKMTVTSFVKPWKHNSATQPYIPDDESSTTMLWEHKISHTYHEAGNEVVTQIQSSQVHKCPGPVLENSRDGIIPDVKLLQLHAGTQH